MLKYWTATSLVALVLLGCVIDQGVKAQGIHIPRPRASFPEKPQIPSGPWVPPGSQTPPYPSGPWVPPGPPLPPYPPGPWSPPGPNTPSIPGTPTKPQTPSIPGPPTRPQTPSVPGTPTKPQTPSIPGTPTKPQTPSIPGHPSRPQTPSIPGTPSKPQTPSIPGHPSRPQTPGVLPPWGPPGGQTPSIPGKPPRPQTPGVLPPWGPPGGQKPSTPSIPQKPSTPGTPSTPQRPSTPGKPSTPQRPSTPGKPPTPQRPSTPGKPSTPQRPSTPGTPSIPSKTQNPWTSTGSHTSSSPYGSAGPTHSSNTPTMYSKTPPKYLPRSSQGQKVPQTGPYTPGQSQGSHQTGVTKTPGHDICEVEEKRKIPCGPSGISSSECQEIGCCFDGHSCYYGKAVTVQCTKDGHFIVVVAKYTTLPTLDLDSIYMYGEGQNCVYVDSNSDFAIYYFSVSECGTVVREEEPGVITYENIMVSAFEVQDGPYGRITRDTTYDLFFQCRYTATSVHSLIIELLPGDPPRPVASMGPVRVQMQIANGQCLTKGCNEVEAAYTSFYTLEEYPVQKVLREPVYIQVDLLERTDPLLVLTLDHCWTTTSPNPHYSPQWDILIDGCPNTQDPYSAVLVPVGPEVPFPGHVRRFYFKMFAFVDSGSGEPMSQQLYLHCSTSLCLAAPGAYCEPACFRKLKKREAVTPQKKVERNVVVTAGPVTISAPKA